MATWMASKSPAGAYPASDYLTVKSLLNRHILQMKDGPVGMSPIASSQPKLNVSSSTMTPRTNRKIEMEFDEMDVHQQIAACRDKQHCGTLQDLLDNFHQAFSEDQLWAIIFQYITLYRNAIVRNAGRAGSSAAQNSSHNSSSGTMSSQMSEWTPEDSPSRRKSKSAGESGKKRKRSKRSYNKSSGSSKDGSDSEDLSSSSCSTSSDVEASDNSDIVRELLRVDSGTGGDGGDCGKRGNKNSCAKPQVVLDTMSECGSSASSDEGGGGGGAGDDRSDNGKPKSRLDHVDYLNVPTSLRNFHVHKDGSVHVSYVNEGECSVHRTGLVLLVRRA